MKKINKENLITCIIILLFILITFLSKNSNKFLFNKYTKF